MPQVAVDRLKVGDIVQLEGEGENPEARIRTLSKTFTLGASPEKGDCRDVTFFDYPGSVRLFGKVQRTGHQPLNKAELVELGEQQSSTVEVQPALELSPAEVDDLLQDAISSRSHQLPTEVVRGIDDLEVTENPKVVKVKAVIPLEEPSLPVPTGTDPPTTTVVSTVSESDNSSGDDGEARILSIQTRADRLAITFYGISAACAVVGSALGVVEKVTGWPDSMPLGAKLLVAAFPVTVVELGGVVSAALADVRRQKGEQAYGFRFLSGTVAVGAIFWQLYSHDLQWYGWLFAGLSAFAYFLYLLTSAAKRRDALRVQKKMLQVAHTYPLWMQVRHPQVVRLAKSLAISNGYNIVESLEAAREELDTQHRHATISRALRRAIRKTYKDPDAAKIALATYDLDKLAAKIEGNADYEGWAAVISKNLAPRELED